MGVPKFSDLLAASSPKLASTTAWYINFPVLQEYAVVGGMLKPTGAPVKCKYPFLAAECPLQLDAINTTPAKRDNKDAQVPASVSTNNITIQVYEEQEYSNSDYFIFWRSLVFDPVTSLWGIEQVYRKSITLTAFKKISSSPKTPPAIMKFEMRGAFPVDDITYGYSQTSGALTLDVQFSHTGLFPKRVKQS